MLPDGFLITEWTYEYKRYRLVRAGTRHVARYVVERDDRDTLGGPHWVPVQQWWDTQGGRKDDEATHAMIRLVQSLLEERNERERMAAGHA